MGFYKPFWKVNKQPDNVIKMSFVNLIAGIHENIDLHGGCSNEVKLPIVEVDGVECDCYVRVSDKKREIVIQLRSKRIIDTWEDDNNIILYSRLYSQPTKVIQTQDENGYQCRWEPIPYENGIANEKTFIEFCNTVYDELTKIKLDMCGMMIVPGGIRQYSVDEALECLKGISNIKLDAPDDCCVCMNKTYTKTFCKHPLCYRCWFKIPDVTDGDSDDSPKMPCPLCRKNIFCSKCDADE